VLLVPGVIGYPVSEFMQQRRLIRIVA
jgi:hypothetical protein